MKKIIPILLIFSTIQLFSQSIEEIDSTSFKFCDYIKTINNIENDTLRINTLYENKFYPFLQNVEPTEVDQIAQKLYYRMQKNCVEFRELLDRLDPPKEGVTRTTEKPNTKLLKKGLKAFQKIQNFKYYEADGKIATVTMKNNIWTDHFADSTYSKLNYIWISDYEFELDFIESNNESRSNFSVKGDKYIYGVIEKGSDHYILSVNIEGQNIYEVFKLYVD